MKNHFVILCAVAVMMGGSLVVHAAQQFGDPLEPVPGSIPGSAARPPNWYEIVAEAAAKPTPRAVDGRPDLTGFWADPIREREIVISEDGSTLTVIQEHPAEADARAQPNFKNRAADDSYRPKYIREEDQARQRELMHAAGRIDPGINCRQKGVPRIGAPTEIVQTPSTIYFLYAAEWGEDQTHTFRIIPIGGQHDPEQDPKPNGDSIAWWEGDTLVVDVVNLDPDTWLDGDGDFHDENLHVVERFTRKGDSLEYDVTIEDPTMFTEPWRPEYGQVRARIGSRTRIVRSADEHAAPDYQCIELDSDHKVNNDRP